MRYLPRNTTYMQIHGSEESSEQDYGPDSIKSNRVPIGPGSRMAGACEDNLFGEAFAIVRCICTVESTFSMQAKSQVVNSV